ncbi:MAG TPA: retropepsin-like aspartic protease [Thermodesulfovibrionales bacterium]|nr:retropepsin-like aspartic protease [Thermodesulfovibrionales bacterium]
MRFRVMLSLIFVLSLINGEHLFADEAVPFAERNGVKYVTAYINGVPMELVFDTGSNKVVLNSSGFERIGGTGLDDTKRLQIHTAGGVTEGYVIKINSIRVGNIERNDYEVAYVPASTANLLGASFFNSYSYFVDEDYKVIRIVPKGSYFLDSPEKPVVDRQKTGSGRIEVEIDGEKFMYEGGKLIRQGP